MFFGSAKAENGTVIFSVPLQMGDNQVRVSSGELEDSETYKKAEKFVNDVQEIADNTAADIDAHFGTGETEPETQPQV